MSDLMFNRLEYTNSMIFLLIFQMSFLKLRYSRKISIVISLMCLILAALADTVDWYVFPDRDISVIMTLVKIFLVQGTAFLLCSYRDARTLFTGFSSACYVMAGDIFCKVGEVSNGQTYVALFLQLVIHGFVLFELCMRLRKPYLEEMQQEENRYWLPLCLIPALFYTVFYGMMRWPSNLKDNPGNVMPAVTLIFLMIIAYVLVVSIFWQKRKERELQGDHAYLVTYARGLEHEADAVRRLEERLAISRHDLRHSYQIMSERLEAGDLTAVKQMLAQETEKVQHLVPRHLCKNVVLNGIFTGMEEMAKERSVRFDCKADAPVHFVNLNEYELATVIANLVENAVVAAAENADHNYVEIRMRPVKKQYFLEIRNSFSGICDISEETGLPISHHGIGHGYGMRSVQAFAAKHRAVFEYEIRGQEFCATLLFED